MSFSFYSPFCYNMDVEHPASFPLGFVLETLALPRSDAGLPPFGAQNNFIYPSEPSLGCPSPTGFNRHVPEKMTLSFFFVFHPG